MFPVSVTYENPTVKQGFSNSSVIKLKINSAKLKTAILRISHILLIECVQCVDKCIIECMDHNLGFWS